jgi:hypothetical protein
MRLSDGWAIVWCCDGCGTEVERREWGQTRRSGRPRRWCTEACRMRTARVEKSPEIGVALCREEAAPPSPRVTSPPPQPNERHDDEPRR